MNIFDACPFFQGVAGGSGNGGYDGAVFLQERVEQAGFSDIGFSDQGDPHSFANDPSLAKRVNQLS